jgi:hypothetical protein
MDTSDFFSNPGFIYKTQSGIITLGNKTQSGIITLGNVFHKTTDLPSSKHPLIEIDQEVPISGNERENSENVT